MNWRKIVDLDSTYVHTKPAEISQRKLCEELQKHVSRAFGAGFKYGISNYIATNQVGGEFEPNFEGVDTLFEETT